MSRNERYIAYTRALSELILVIDEQIPVFNHSEDDEKTDRRKPRRQQTTHKKAKTGILNYSASQNKQAQYSTSTIAGQKSSNGKNEYNSPNSDIKGQESTVALGNENITETSPLISTALKELPKGSIEMTAVGALTGKYHLVPYSGKLRNFTSKKATSMYTPQIRAGKRTKVPVSIIDESHLIFITKDLFKLYEKAFKSSSEIEIVL